MGFSLFLGMVSRTVCRFLHRNFVMLRKTLISIQIYKISNLSLSKVSNGPQVFVLKKAYLQNISQSHGFTLYSYLISIHKMKKNCVTFLIQNIKFRIRMHSSMVGWLVSWQISLATQLIHNRKIKIVNLKLICKKKNKIKMYCCLFDI